MSINIDFYNNNAEELSKQYNSLTFEQVHKNILHLIPQQGSILDIGCGSGRDSFALANKGLAVTAVDPSHSMLNLAKKDFQHDNICWIEDKLPNLEHVLSLNKKFDFILLSAVWMHIEKEDREEAFKSLTQLLNKNATMVIYLRHGEFTDGRKEIEVSSNEIINLSDNQNIISTPLLQNSKDVLNRAKVSWEIISVQNTPKRTLRNNLKR